MLVAQECKSLEFESASDMWFRTPSTLFRCPEGVSPDVAVRNSPCIYALSKHRMIKITPWFMEQPSFFPMYQKVFWASFLWGTGTAIGEIPPYWVSRAARLAEEVRGHRRETHDRGTKIIDLSACVCRIMAFQRSWRPLASSRL